MNARMTAILAAAMTAGMPAAADGGEEHYYIRPLPEAVGFATWGDGITGGAGGVEVTVATAEELLRYASSNEPYVINVVDTIEIVRGIGEYAEKNGAYRIGSNTTIRGVGTNATILYGAFWISNSRNVIIQNLHFDGTYDPTVHDYKHQLAIGEKGPANDAIEIGHGSENVWVTQNSFRRYSDEVLSVYSAASYVTISRNRFDDPVTGQQGMMILIGSSDTQTQDIGRLNTTLHHNYMASRTRHPRTRFGKFHIFNNYYHNIGTYGIASTMDAEVVVEGNYFQNVNNPWHIGYGTSREGYLAQRNNIFIATAVPGTRGAIGEEIFDPSDYYEYTLDDAADVPALVLDGAGAGSWDITGGVRPIPSAPEQVSPSWGSTESVRPEFTWTPSVLVDHYEFVLLESGGTVVLDTLLAESRLELPFELDGDRNYFWRIRAVNESGATPWTGSTLFRTESTTRARSAEGLPARFSLYENYPNPFNPVTTIRYGVPEIAHVDLRVFDVAGRTVAVLVNEIKRPGYYNIEFGRGSLTSGTYLLRMAASAVSGSPAETFSQARTMTILK
jgi:pectate lyase